MKNLQRVGAILVIIAATLLVYWPALRNGFVWDDTALVQRDPLIRSWRLIPEGFRHFLFLDATASNFYRPLQRLSFTADYALWDRSASGWHLTSIYLHIAAAIALFFLAEKLLANRVSAGAIAVLWAIHPLHTSAVTYIAGRADPLQALFGFAGLTLALAGLDEARKGAKAQSSEEAAHPFESLRLCVRFFPDLCSGAAAVCFLCALLSKEAGFSALLIWFAILAWRHVPRAVWGKWIALGAAVVAIYGALRFTAESTPPPQQDVPPLAARPILVARAVAEYAGLILAPVNLRMERDVSSGVGIPSERPANAQRREWQTLLGFALIAGGIGWWHWAKRRAPNAALALIAGLVAYLPISNLFALNASVAEHWLYVPLAFLFIALAASLPANRKIAAFAFVAFVPWAAWLAGRTWQRQSDWKDQRTFLERNIAAGGDSARMRVNLGQVESAAGRDDLALEEMRMALTLAPEQPFALLGAATILVRLNQLEAADPLLAKAERHPVLATECRVLRASMARMQGADIAPLLREAALAAPTHWPVWRRYLAELDRADRRAEAIRELRVFLERQSFRAESWAMLGDLLSKEHDAPRAMAAFTEAARLDVHDADSRARLGILERTPAP